MTSNDVTVTPLISMKRHLLLSRLLGLTSRSGIIFGPDFESMSNYVRQCFECAIHQLCNFFKIFTLYLTYTGNTRLKRVHLRLHILNKNSKIKLHIWSGANFLVDIWFLDCLLVLCSSGWRKWVHCYLMITCIFHPCPSKHSSLAS